MIIWPNRKALLGILLLCLTLIVASLGLHQVPPGSRGCVFLFGAQRPELLSPGLHWFAPWPIAEVRIVPSDTVRQIRLENLSDTVLASRTTEYLTGDANLLNVALRLDYRVADPAEIARTGLDEVERRLVPLAEASLVSVLAGTRVADALGPGREPLAQSIRDHVQQRADRLALGVRIAGVVWIEIVPPQEVRREFENAQNAISEAARTIAEADRQAAAESLAVTGETAEIVAKAESDALEAKAQAGADARSFLALLKQARRTGFLPTGRKLWLDTLAEILPKLKGRTVLATDQPVDLTIIRNSPLVDVPAAIVKP